MSDTTRIAERIARILEGEHQDELASVLASLEKINHRLDKLESVPETRRPTIPASQLLHPSQEKFAVLEAVADQIIDGLKNEKACTFEPHKPCDHCSMCSSRGF